MLGKEKNVLWLYQDPTIMNSFKCLFQLPNFFIFSHEKVLHSKSEGGKSTFKKKKKPSKQE